MGLEYKGSFTARKNDRRGKLKVLHSSSKKDYMRTVTNNWNNISSKLHLKSKVNINHTDLM